MESKNLELVRELRHQLHRHPELSNHEVWTKQHLMDFVKNNTSLEIVDRGKYFYVVYRAGEGRKNIAFRADFDAVPIEETIDLPYGSVNEGVSHKCGHDGHSAGLAGFLLEVDQKGADSNIFFIFQHAEETGDGAREAAAFITENNIDEIFAYHNMSGYPLKSINIIDGTTHCASAGMTIHMDGVPSHASLPENGRNPAFAIAKIIDSIPGLISSKDNRGMVLCTVIQVDIGEKAFGVSASKGDLLLTVRALYEDELDMLIKNLENIAQDEAGKYGLSVSFHYNDIFPETYNHKESTDKVREICRSAGFELREMDAAIRSSEDFGYYLKLTKGAMFYIGNGENYPPIHTFEYDFNDEIIETGVEIFKALAGMEP